MTFHAAAAAATIGCGGETSIQFLRIRAAVLAGRPEPADGPTPELVGAPTPEPAVVIDLERRRPWQGQAALFRSIARLREGEGRPLRNAGTLDPFIFRLERGVIHELGHGRQVDPGAAGRSDVVGRRTTRSRHCRADVRQMGRAGVRGCAACDDWVHEPDQVHDLEVRVPTEEAYPHRRNPPRRWRLLARIVAVICTARSR
jgi:hypothetical protein